MRGKKLWMFLTLAVILAVVGVYFALLPEKGPASLPPGESVASLGLVLVSRDEGAYVKAVSERSPASNAGVKPGDVIVASGPRPIRDAGALESLLGDGVETIPLTVNRQGQLEELVLNVR